MRKLEIDRRTAKLSGARLHGSNESLSYPVPASVSHDAEIAQPQALGPRMRLEFSAEQDKTDDAACILGNKTFEPPIGPGPAL